MTDVKEIIESINRYNRLAIVFLGLAILLMILSVVLWHKLNIKNSLRVVTGFGASKAVAKLRADTEKDGIHQTGTLDKVAPVITWSTLSGQITKEPTMETVPLTKSPVMRNYTVPKEPTIQTMASPQLPDINIDLIVNKNPSSAVFTVEKDVVYTAVNL